MANLIRYTMTNVPTGVSQMYVRITDTSNNEIYSGIEPISGNAVEIDIGMAGNTGEGVVIFADNYQGNIPAFKGYVGYSSIVASTEGFLDASGKIYNTSVINQNSEIWS